MMCAVRVSKSLPEVSVIRVKEEKALAGGLFSPHSLNLKPASSLVLLCIELLVPQMVHFLLFPICMCMNRCVCITNDCILLSKSSINVGARNSKSGYRTCVCKDLNNKLRDYP